MMAWIEERCPTCGGPLPAADFADVLVCKFCRAELRAAPGAQYRIPPKIDEPPFRPELARVSIAGTRYAVIGQLAEGTSADVFLARRDARLAETVVLKIARADGAERVEAEWKTLAAIENPSREGAAHFSRVLPLRVEHGRAEDGRVASVFRWRAGFQFTLEDVRREYPSGVDARTLVWMWKRLLEIVGWVNDGGFSHGAIDPTHVIVNPRDHGVAVVGWSRARRAAGDDVAATARVMKDLASADAPPAIRDWLEHPSGSAWDVERALGAAARDAFGPPQFHRFTMSGWG